MRGGKVKNSHTGRVPSTAAVLPAGKYGSCTRPQQLLIGNEKSGDLLVRIFFFNFFPDVNIR